ncbi:hypothetical protein [Streptomyces sp. NPDC005385]|uniref:hypothetical protein n=1 Tax=Streptomyces sp. NPDC005385 TaxID=3157039 RepID=UPI0033AE6979
MSTPTIDASAAEQAVTDARMAYANANDDLTALRNKILIHGPEAVSAPELATAAAHVEHAKLSVEHALAELDQALGNARLHNLNTLKAQILEDAGTHEEALNAMQQIEQGVAHLVASCAGRQRHIAQWIGAMQRAGVPAAVGQQTEDGHAELGWSNANMAGGDAILVGQRRIASINPGTLIAAAIARGTRTAGYSTGHLAPVLQVDGQGALMGDPEDWLKRRY